MRWRSPAMARFRLVPLEEKSAMEQLFDCASMATSVIMRSHAWYKLYGENRDELFDLIRDATVSHFISYKVRRHTYAYTTKEGKPLNFADNVISSCFSVAGNIADSFMKRLIRFNETQDLEPIKFWVGENDRLPIYVSDEERVARYKYKPKLDRPYDRARAARKEYENYLDEFKEMGLTGKPLELGAWLVRNGYGDDDELFFYMESKEERRKLLQGQARWVFETKQAERDALIKNKSVLHAQIYNREYKRRKRHEEWMRKSAELEKLLGKPPDGYIWRERHEIVGLYKMREEKHESDR